MQYEVNVPTYKRVDNKKINRRVNLKATPMVALMILVVGLMLGRVNFTFVEGLAIAPFGIAYLLSIIVKEDLKRYFIAFLGVVAGYLSIYKNINDALIYIGIATVILLYGYIITKLDRKVSKKIVFSLAILVFAGIGAVIGKNSLAVNLGFSLVEAIAIIPVFYIINYGIDCISEIKTNYFFSMEELISIAIVLCLIVAGVGNIEIFGVAIRNVVALSMIVTVAYAGGSAAGTILGVTMGLIIGVANNDILVATTLYSICGLIVGVFKETGKIFSVLAYVVSYFIVVMYSGEIGLANVVEMVITSSVLLVVPASLIKNILIEINNEEKSKVINNIQVQGMKSEFVDRLESLKGVLGSISTSLNNLSENDKLLLKNKGTALVENLADRVCANCEMNRKCWDRELHSTFVAFGEMIRSCEMKDPTFPKELEGKCVKKTTLLRNAEDLLNIYSVNEALKNRLVEGRQLVAKQIDNMSASMDDIIKDFEKDVTSCVEIDKLLRKTLIKNRIRYNDIYTYTDREGRLKIKVKLDNCDGTSYCVKNILPVISDLVRTPLCLSDDGCRINPETDECSIVIEETPKYHMVSYAAFTPKDGEKYSGDSFSFGKNKNGIYITAVSDGMGSGPEAGLESTIAIDLVEKFMESGFSESTTLNTVNSIMGMKFNEDEKFTTLDMNAVDLYSGETSFMKVGGVVSFIKTGNEVEVVESSSLPFGILDSMEVETIKKKIKHGDIIITISDGILDVDKNDIGNHNWLMEFLKNGTTNPEVLSREILDKAKELSKGKVFDDMTVVVSKAYSVY